MFPSNGLKPKNDAKRKREKKKIYNTIGIKIYVIKKIKTNSF